jgi:hypothetical protein
MLEKLRRNLQKALNTGDVQFIKGNSKLSTWEVKVGDHYATVEITASNGVVKHHKLVSVN